MAILLTKSSNNRKFCMLCISNATPASSKDVAECLANTQLAEFTKRNIQKRKKKTDRKSNCPKNIPQHCLLHPQAAGCKKMKSTVSL